MLGGNVAMTQHVLQLCWNLNFVMVVMWPWLNPCETLQDYDL